MEKLSYEKLDKFLEDLSKQKKPFNFVAIVTEEGMKDFDKAMRNAYKEILNTNKED